jgi:hypothetical protein
VEVKADLIKVSSAEVSMVTNQPSVSLQEDMAADQVTEEINL